MSEYISREAAKEQLKRFIAGSNALLDLWIDAIPAADVVKVVRCADCVHCESASDGWCRCENTDAGMPLDGFCSDGERNGGADNG